MYTYSMATWTKPKYAVFVLYITGQYRILQNSVKTYKFRGNWPILWLGSKFRVLQKTVVPKHESTEIICWQAGSNSQ